MVKSEGKRMKKADCCVAILFLLFVITPSGLALGQGVEVSALEAGSCHSVALRSDGTVWTWGCNGSGQLGDGTWSNRNVPTRVAILVDIVAVAAGQFHSLAVRVDGTVWAWGWNTNSQLGDGTTSNQPTPVQVEDPSDPTGFLTNVVAVAAGERHSLALKQSGEVWSWGYNANGQLGDGTFEGKTVPVRVREPSDPSGFLTGVSVIAAGALHSVALKNEMIWTWGSRGYEQLGRNPYAPGAPSQAVAGQVPGLSNVKAIAAGWEHTVVLKTDGTVWACGRNLEGQFGDGTTAGSSFGTPQKVFAQAVDTSDQTGFLTDVAVISANNRHTQAAKTNGTVWTWGWNYGGNFCDGTTTNSLVPVEAKDPTDPTTFLTGVIDVAAGYEHNVMMKSDGSIWGCGYNYSGHLGDGTWTSPRLTPVRAQLPLPSLLYVWGLNYISPGEEGTFLIEYQNFLGFTLENAIVVFNIPGAFSYVSSTDGGIYRSDKQQVFWKLGNVSPGAGGQLYVKLSVPWGLALHSKGSVTVNMGASNHPSTFNVDEYLQYNSVKVLSQTTLTPQEIAVLLSLNQSLNDLLNHARSLGLLFFDTAQQISFNDGTSLVRLVLFDPLNFAPVFINSNGNQVLLEKVGDDQYSISDLNGGMTANRNDGSIQAWGSWAESHSLTFYHCMFNCAVEGIPSFLLGKYLKVIGGLSDAKDCVECALTQDVAVCEKCGDTLLDFEWEHFKEYVDILKCAKECYDDPDSHVCTEDKVECDPNGLWRWISTNLFEEDVEYHTKCNTALGGIYGATVAIQCAIGEVCSNGRCSDPGTICRPPSCTSKEFELRTAHDPNIKYSDVKGEVLSGQNINYTIEYENLGAGTAYGVFILDVLDPNLNEATLTINNGGSYLASGRLLSWEIGTLTPGQTGSVSFSVNIRTGLPDGTQIVNKADVFFPSANEITPTNPVVHVIGGIAGVPQTVETMSGTPASITLTGRGLGSLDYRVTSGPRFGSLAGGPPSLTYESMAGFTGQDTITFVVTNGSLTSLPALITINVNPNPSDTLSPEVLKISPPDGTYDVPVSAVPVATNPNRYIPAITATFSKALDPTTVNASTVQVTGVSGSVSYNEQTKAVVFMPLSPLASSTVYTVQLKTGIKDKVGNPLASEYSWLFTTESLANIVVTLPENAAELDFGEVPVNVSSQEKVVSVENSGSSNLILGSLAMAGEHSGDFTFNEDKCSGKTLTQYENCTVKVAFQPASPGPKGAFLSIPSNDPDRSSANVSLKGRATAQGISFTIDPEEGTMGTEIVIMGSGFGTKKGKVLIGGVATKIVSWTNTAITAVIKNSPPPGAHDLVLQLKEPNGVDPITLQEGFTIMAPDIVSDEPNSGIEGTAVIISGNFFGIKKGAVYLGNKKCKVSLWNMNTITFIVPKKMDSGFYDLTVTNKVGSETLPEAFEIVTP
jgi:uncharacterized repeat protein (TIGR01451 family)